MRNFSIVSAAFAALVVLSACADGQPVEAVAGTAGCTGCHGGKDNQSGAPPFDAAGGLSSVAVGAHTRHVDAGVECIACHLDPRVVTTTTTHGSNGIGDVVFSGLADPQGVASYARATLTCSSVYCHAPSTAPGGTQPTPVWTGTLTGGCGSCHAGPPSANVHGAALASTQCALCHATSVDGAGEPVAGGTHVNGAVNGFAHPAGWTTPNANGVTPHGAAATYQDAATYPTGFDGCRDCHGSDLDNTVAPAKVPSCDACHTGGTAAWRTDCTFCHGDSVRADSAPPRDVAGSLASAAVGAHQVHLLGKPGDPTISNGVACDDCHGGTTRTLPTSFDPHANGTTEVTLKQPGQNGQTGSYDPGSGTCSSVYCHGNLPRNPRPGNNPSWTATSGQSDCGSCHAANGTYCGGAASACTDVRTGQHETHRCARCHGNIATVDFSTQVGCFACHPQYQRQLDTTTPRVNLSIHVDGLVEVVGTTSGLFQNFNLDLTYSPPSGPNPASCTTNCHQIGAHGGPSGSANW